MIKIYCDRCEEEVGRRAFYLEVRQFIPDSETRGQREQKLNGMWTVCEPCVRKFYGFIEEVA